MTTRTVTLRSSAGSVPATLARSGSTNERIRIPASPLAATTRYTVTVVGGASGITDLPGHPLAKTVTSVFTTA